MSSRIYLDNIATSWPKPEVVYKAVDDYMRNVGAATGRGAYRSTQKAEQVVARARDACARLLGCASGDYVIFGSNGTDVINIGIHGFLRPGDHVVTSRCEHNSILRPLEHLRRDADIEVTHVPIDEHGRFTPEDVAAAMRPDTAMVAVLHGSNVTGVIQPIEETVAAVRASVAPEAVVLLDASQTTGHLHIDMTAMDLDLLASGGHKGMLGPLGTGLLCMRPGMEQRLRPIKQGGTGVNSESPTQPDTLPDWLETGNTNTPALAGLAASVELILEKGVDHFAENALLQARRLARAVADMPGVTLYGPGPDDERLPVVSIAVEGYTPQEFGAALDAAAGIECRAGLHCAPMLHDRLGSLDSGGLVRFGTSWATTTEEIDRTIECITQLAAAHHVSC